MSGRSKNKAVIQLVHPVTGMTVRYATRSPEPTLADVQKVVRLAQEILDTCPPEVTEAQS